MLRDHIILKFLLLSAMAHTLALASWSTPTPPKARINATLSVDFAALEPAPAKSSASPPAPPVTLKPAQPVTAQSMPSQSTKTKSAPVATPQRARTKEHERKRHTDLTLPTTPMRSARRSEVVVARASQTQRVGEIKKHSIVEAGTPAVARPWEPVWGSVRYYTPGDEISTASAAAALMLRPPPQSTTSAAGMPAASLSKAARALIRGRLETDLSRYFSYPPLARQRGWQGHVRVAFTVQADGQLTDARITHSSGYHVLDASALEALRRVGRLPQARDWLHGQTLTMELPVIYRLEN